MQKKISIKITKNKTSDRILVKRVGEAVIDTAVITIDSYLGGTPLMTGAWALTKALLGNAVILRQEKAMEWVEMIQESPEIFTKKIIESEDFQDAFVTSFEVYIKERNDDKRLILKEIFKDYTKSDVSSDYPLERFNEITRQITIFDAKNFSYLKYLSSEQVAGRSFQGTQNTTVHLESILHLVSLGLLIRDDNQQLIKENSSSNLPYIHISSLGNHYYRFINNANIKY